MFDRHGQMLITATKLAQVKVLTSHLDRETFIDLYPFLPQHLDLLLILLGRLAKTWGGVGLRSAIKVVQDVLIESGRAGAAPLADEEVGKLANAVIFYDCLRQDVQRSFPHVVQGVEKAIAAFGADSLEGRLAKTVGVLQIIDDFPLTAENAAALMLPSVDAEPLQEKVRQAVKKLLDEPLVPFAEVDGRLRFMSPAVDDLNKKRQTLQPSTSELRDVYVQALRDIFSPRPVARTGSGKNVAAGIKLAEGAGWFAVQDDGEEMQVHISFQKGAVHKHALADAAARSRTPEQSKAVFLLASEDDQMEHLAIEHWRSRKIYDSEHARAVDKEETGYLSGQRSKAQALLMELTTWMRQSMTKGSFIFRGQPVAVATLSSDLGAAVREELGSAGEEVFGKFRDAAVQAEASAAEGLLKTANLSAVSSKNDPLGFVDKMDGRGAIKMENLAFRDIRDYLDTRGLVEGKKLLDDFAQAPFGWFKDTTRYIVAAMLASGIVKVRVSGIEIPTPTPQAIEALKGQQSFNKIGVMLRGTPPDPALLLRTAERLLELTGKTVVPLERDISAAVLADFPDFQNSYAALAATLSGCGLAGSGRAEELCARISELLRGDASDAPFRLGQEDSALYRDLCWARDAVKALEEGAGKQADRAERILSGISTLPQDGGALESIKEKNAQRLTELRAELEREDWPSRRAEINQHLSALEADVTAAILDVTQECAAYAERRWADIQSSADFTLLSAEEREAISAERPGSTFPAGTGIEDLENLIRSRYSTAMRFDKMVSRIGQRAAEIRDAAAGNREYRITIKRGTVRDIGELDEAAERIEEGRDAFGRGDTVIIE